MAWLVVLVAAVVLWTLLLSVLPHPPPPWRRRAARLVRRAADRVQRRGPPEPDPFEALRVQSRLGVLAGEIHDLEADLTVFARVHRLAALQAAYDDLLREACVLAGVPPVADDRRGDDMRWHEEQELAARGWSW
jgi:hypothetical protein